MKRRRYIYNLILILSFSLIINDAKPFDTIVTNQSAMALSMDMIIHHTQDCCATVDHELHCGCSVSSAVLALTHQPLLFPEFTLVPGQPFAKPVKRSGRLERPPKWIG